jgi:uncharacterized protein (TIGR00661 family)
MKILFGVFDWGLGHATRDIPLISELSESNEVHIISTGGALRILKNHFRDRCKYHDVPSVYPPYTSTRFFQAKFTVCIPKMMENLRSARRKAREIIGGGFEKVISDCRYDVYDRTDNSYLINHQLRFKTPFGAERIFERWLASRMKQYRYVIVPDFKERSLSGKLSHNLRYVSRDRIKYIGILSQMKRLNIDEDIECFVSLSGPEPQRTILGRKIISQANHIAGRIVVAGGNPDNESRKFFGNVEFYGFLGARQQENMMNRAKFILARAGYTTVMELAELNKKNVLLVPTPGQTEQEYLADYYEGEKYFHHISQYRLALGRDIEKSKGFRGFDPTWRTEESIREFIRVIKS